MLWCCKIPKYPISNDSFTIFIFLSNILQSSSLTSHRKLGEWDPVLEVSDTYSDTESYYKPIPIWPLKIIA